MKHHPRTVAHAQWGFTLIELLVVITIITMLIAILLPALRQAREAAQAIACASNERQMGVAAFLYADSYDGWSVPGQCYSASGSIPFKLWWDPGSPGMERYGYWYHMLMGEQYLPRPHAGIRIYPGDDAWNTGSAEPPVESIMVCPTAPELNHDMMFGYGMNTFVAGASPHGTPADNGYEPYRQRTWKKLYRLLKPSETIYVGDKLWPNPLVGYPLPKLDGTWGGYLLSDRHGGAGNILYADGHVDRRPAEEVQDARNFWAYVQ